MTRSCDQPAVQQGKIDIELWVAVFDSQRSDESFDSADRMVVDRLRSRGEVLERALEDVRKSL